MKKLRFVPLLLLALAFTFPPVVKMEYSFKVGDEYMWVQKTTQTIKQSIMGMEQTMDNTYEGEFSLKVVEVNGDVAKIETRYKRIKSLTKSPMGEKNMDSEAGDASTENKVLKGMVDKPFYLHINKLGTIVKLEGVDNLWTGLKDLGLDENTQKVMRQSLEQLMGESSLKATFEQVLVTYPDKKLKEGDKWSVKNSVAMNFPVEIENTWSLGEVTSSVANLTGDGIYTTTDKEKQIPLPGGLKAKADLGGKQAMKSSVNVKTGWPTKLDVLSELKGKMTLLAGGMIPEDMDVPMEIVSETSFVITKK